MTDIRHEQLAVSTPGELLRLVLALGSCDPTRPIPGWWVRDFSTLRERDSVLRAWASPFQRDDSLTAEAVLLAIVSIGEADCPFGPASWSQITDAARLVLRVHSLETQWTQSIERRSQSIAYDMAYGLSHELNNPLANIATRARLLAEEEPDDRRRQILATIVDQALRGGEMIGDLMLMARPPKLQKTRQGVWQTIERIVADAEPWFVSRNRKLSWNQDAQVDISGFTVDIDPTAVREAIWALLRNALEASRSEVWINVTVRPSKCSQRSAHQSLSPQSLNPVTMQSFDETANGHGCCDFVQIMIEDDGSGLSADALERAFHPYYSGREAGRGLGLGLPKAKRIAEAHGGWVSLQNSTRGGCTACFRLPISSGSSDQPSPSA